MQTVFVIFIIFILGFIAFMVVISQQKSSTKTQLEQSLVITQVKKAQILSLLPELHCSRENVLIADCYDKLAINSFKTRSDQLYYKSLLGNAIITIKEYDFSSGWSEEIIFSNPKEKYETKKLISVPVRIYQTKENLNKVGVIDIEIYN